MEELLPTSVQPQASKEAWLPSCGATYIDHCVKRIQSLSASQVSRRDQHEHMSALGSKRAECRYHFKGMHNFLNLRVSLS